MNIRIFLKLNSNKIIASLVVVTLISIISIISIYRASRFGISGEHQYHQGVVHSTQATHTIGSMGQVVVVQLDSGEMVNVSSSDRIYIVGQPVNLKELKGKNGSRSVYKISQQ